MKKEVTILLTSRENFIWASMQEIIPHIEYIWTKACSLSQGFEIINVDQTELSTICKKALFAKNIIIACFNFKIAKVIKVIKEDLSSSARLIFHLHNQATIGLWPMFQYGMLKFFDSKDIFISSCSRDADALSISINNPNVTIIPFSLDEQILNEYIKESIANKIYYAGRISRQKNIHSIVYAIAKLREENIYLTFDIYGEEDFLGSPNMGVSETSYESELKEIIQKLSLDDCVKFHGKLSREELYNNALIKKQIFISTSTHSDENFGMAAFRAICRGDKLILSDWGGHSDFKENFKNQIEYVSVIKGNANGLATIVDDVKNAIFNSINKDFPSIPNVTKYNSVELLKLYRKILNSPFKESSPIKFTNNFYQIIQNKEKYHNHLTKIFANYEDPLAIQFCIAYGLKTN